MSKRVTLIPLDQRVKSTVRAVILARMSDPNAKDVTMETQVEACEAFIERMGWPQPTLGPFTDKASGYYRVEREALDEVEQLIAKRQIDVVVALNYKRVSRDDMRRKAALYHARKYGVEYRFAEIKPNGKFDDTIEGKAVDAIMGLVGEIDRQNILANLQRGKAKRRALGYPSGGRGGPPYGFRKALETDPYKYWAERQDEADNLRFMYTWLAEMAETKDPRGSVRGLVRELSRRGSVTRNGCTWSSQTVTEKLRNPLYCGKGRLNRWITTREEKTDEDTGETYDLPVSRFRDPKETEPIGPDMVPTLVVPELWDKVQAIIDEGNTSAGRLGRKDGHPEDATLLHSGFIRCALCGKAMIRYWRIPTKKHPEGPPNYRCSTDASQPDACTRHSMPAKDAEDFAFRAIARVLSDPEKIVALADAAEGRLEKADYAVVKTTNDIEAMEEELAKIDQEVTDTLAAISALSKLPGQQSVVDGLRGHLLELNASRDRAEIERTRLAPKRDRAEERANLLRQMFLHRDDVLNMVQVIPVNDGKPVQTLEEWLPILHASMLLGVWGNTGDDGFSPEWLAGLLGESSDDWPDIAYKHTYTGHEDGTKEYMFDEVRTDYVVYCLLRRMEWKRLRRLLRELDVVVRVSPPWSDEIRATRGKTPKHERVSVQVGNLEISGRALVYAADTVGSLDGNNVTKLATPTISTPAAHRSG